jgi:hypothetical protein
LLAALVPAHTAWADPPSPQQNTVPDLGTTSARSWAVDCANYEILVIEHPNSYLRYRLHDVDAKGNRIMDLIETPAGSVSRLILRDGHPLTPAQDAAERERLNDLIASPSTFVRRMRSDQANRKLGTDLLREMPDAMVWSFAPGQPQLPEQTSPPLVVLDFTPNPSWTPPTIPSEALSGLRGRLWVDPRSHRMVRFEGEVFHPVNFGWGFLAHIYPGGKFEMDQINTGGERWLVTHIDEKVTVRELLVKTVDQHLTFDASEFRTIAPMPWQEAIRLLLATPLPTQ